MSRRRPATEDVHRITSAPEPLAIDQARRARRYLVQMGVRIVCFALAVLLWGHVYTWVSFLLIAGAVVLPYIAVIVANAGRERRDEPAAVVDPRLIDAPRAPREPGHLHEGPP